MVFFQNKETANVVTMSVREAIIIINFLRGIRKARTNVHSSNRHGELNLAVTLISICSVFIICHALRLFLGLKAVFLINTTFECMKHMKVRK